MIIKKHFTRSHKNNTTSITSNSLELSNESDTELFDTQFTSQVSDDSTTSSNYFPLSDPQEQCKNNKLYQTKNFKQTTLDYALQVPDIEDILNKQVLCEIIMINLDRHEENCNKIYSISTSTTHLGEYLNTVYRIFSSQQYKKNPKGQTVVESDTWIVEDCQALTVVKEQKFQQFCHEMDPWFKIPGLALIKKKIQESVLFAESQLRDFIKNTMETFSFTTDMWTSMYCPYVGNIRDKLIGETTDNDKLIVKEIRLLGVPHIRYTAHTIQLAIKNGLNTCDDLLSKVMKLNN
ncbi:4888_t:CDS:2, partial [Scutellospora calospora]